MTNTGNDERTPVDEKDCVLWRAVSFDEVERVETMQQFHELQDRSQTLKIEIIAMVADVFQSATNQENKEMWRDETATNV